MSGISVIIPCYNCADEIEQTVESVLANTLSPHEIVAVDDCSTDRTREVLRDLERRYPGIVRVVTCDANMGPGRARNAGVRAAVGEYLFFVDSDLRLNADALQRFARRIDECDAVVGIYAEDPVDSGLAGQYKSRLYYYLLGRVGVQPYDQFSASCAGIRARVYADLGGYDEWFEPGVDLENEEFGHRIAAQYRMLLDPSIQGQHRFPSLGKMTRTFFFRTALWVEMLLVRRRFSTMAGTPSMGLSSVALLAAVLLLPLGLLTSAAFVAAAGAYLVYLYGFAGFFAYLFRTRPRFLPAAFVLSHWFTLVIASGAVLGVAKVVFGSSAIAKRFGRSTAAAYE